MSNAEHHVKVLGRIWIAYSALIAVGAAAAMTFLLLFTEEEKAAGELLFVAAFAVPGLIGGIGLLKRRSWARILVLFFAIINISFPPIGTALGVYTLWVLLKKESARLLAAVPRS